MNASVADWKRWIVIGLSAGTALAVLSGLIFLGFAWYSSRPAPWNNRALTVIWSGGEVWEHERARDHGPWEDYAKHLFVLYFALQNNTARDITIPADATIMKHLLLGGGTLAGGTGAKLATSYFIPAHQRAKVSIELDSEICREADVTQTGFIRCLDDAFADSDGLVLFDSGNRIEVTLPKPHLQ
jgi:hypothetical protein